MKLISREEIIGLGESQRVEFKKSANLMKDAFSTLCGMLNADCAEGRVIFGIEPDGNICGLGTTNLDSLQLKLAEHSGQKFDPPVRFHIEPVSCEGKPLLVVSGRRDKATPFFEYDGRAYIREGSATRVLGVGEKQRLSLARNRDRHNGPWRCDKCGSIAGQISSISIGPPGVFKTYNCDCGGEFWPAT